MDPVPYEIREDDVDEVISAYESVGGGDWTEEDRQEARRHVMRHILELTEEIRSAPEDRRLRTRPAPDAPGTATPPGERPGDALDDALDVRREAALAAIEDLLIRDGFIEVGGEEERVFPVVTDQARRTGE
jgi:hypothetical protein